MSNKLANRVEKELSVISENGYLKSFQKKTLNNILTMYKQHQLDSKRPKAMLNLHSCVSSGKSTMALSLIESWQRLWKGMRNDTITILLTPGGTNTLRNQWDRNAAARLNVGNIYDFNSASSIPLNLCYVVGYDMINGKNNRLTVATVIKRLEELIGSGVKVCIVMDEAHLYQTEKSAKAFYNLDYDCLFRMSATFSTITGAVEYPWDNVVEQGVVYNTLSVPKMVVYNAGLTKRGVKMNEGLSDEVYAPIEIRKHLLTLGHKKTQELTEKIEYLNDMNVHYKGKRVKQLKPLCLVVLGTGSAGIKKKDGTRVGYSASSQFQMYRTMLMEMGVAPEEIAFHTAIEDENFNRDNIVNDDTVRYLFIVQSLRVGWDCPRLAIIINHSKFDSVASGIQLIGRGMRTANGYNLSNIDEAEELKQDTYFQEICEELDYCHLYSLENQKKNILAKIVEEVSINIATAEKSEVYKVSKVAIEKFAKLPVNYVKKDYNDVTISMATVIARTRGLLEFFNTYLKNVTTLGNVYTITDSTSNPLAYSQHNYEWMTGKESGTQGNLVAEVENKTFIEGESTLAKNDGKFKEVTNDAFCISYYEEHTDVQAVLSELSGYLCVNKEELLVVLRNLFTMYNYTYKTKKLLFLESDSDLFQFIVSHRSFLAEMFLIYSNSANLLLNKKEYLATFNMGSDSNNYYLVASKKAAYDKDSTLRRLNYLSSSTPGNGTPVEVTTTDRKTTAFSSAEMMTVDVLEQSGKACKVLVKFYHKHTQKGTPSLITTYEKLEERGVINTSVFEKCKDYINKDGKIEYKVKHNYYFPISFVMEYEFAGSVGRMDALIQTVGMVRLKNGKFKLDSTPVKDLPEKLLSGIAYVKSWAVHKAVSKVNKAGLLYLVVLHEVVGKDKEGNDILNHYLLNVSKVNNLEQAEEALNEIPSTGKYWFKFETFDDLPLKSYYPSLFLH